MKITIIHKIATIYLSIIVFISCVDHDNGTNKPTSLYENPVVVELDTSNRSESNKQIKPITNTFGDTIKTGVALIFNPKPIDSDSAIKPITTEFIQNQEHFLVHKNINKLSEKPEIIEVNEDSVEITYFKSPATTDTANYFINKQGNKILTGIPIEVSVTKNPVPKPDISQAQPLRNRDNILKNVQYLNQEQGLSSAQSWDFGADSKGYLWFNAGGISNKYDGHSFYNIEGYFQFEDHLGNVWMTVEDGIIKNDGYTTTLYKNEDEFDHKPWFEDEKGGIWFTTDYGISVLAQDKITHITCNEGLPSSDIQNLAYDKKGNIWMITKASTSSSSLIKFDGERFFEYKNYLPPRLSSIYIDEKDVVWMGSWGYGLYSFDEKIFTHFHRKNGLPFNVIRRITADDEGNLWLTGWGGLIKYDGESFLTITKEDGLSDYEITGAQVDNANNVWTTSRDAGVNKFNGEAFSYFTKNEGIPHESSWCVLEDKSGQILIGTNGGGFAIYDDTTITQYNKKIYGLPSRYIESIFQDNSGEIWMGTYHGGFVRFDGELFIHYPLNEALFGEIDNEEIMFSISEDKFNNIWLATNTNGVIIFDREKFSVFSEKEGLCNNHVLALHNDKSNNMWVGTINGLTKYDGKNITHFSDKEGLPDNRINDIFEDSEGNIWLATNEGLCKFDGKSFTTYNNQNGLSNNECKSIAQDANGNIWVGTNFGLNVLINPLNENLSPVVIQNYNVSDGLKSATFENSGSIIIDSKNRLIGATSTCVIQIDLNHLKFQSSPTEVLLHDLTINDMDLNYHNIPDSLKSIIEFESPQRFSNYPHNLKLPYDLNHLTFHFSAIDWSAPHKIKYSYKLKGIENNWSPPSAEMKADYRNLPYGEYTFQVCAVGASQEWSDPFELKFSILPPWWHTWWARTSYGVFGFLLVILFVKTRTSQLRKRQVKLEQEINQATHEIVEQKNKIEEAHKEITDSINYAERIQRSFLASHELLSNNLGDYFVYFNPKEAVSGDFYWAGKLENGDFAYSCADSTGHGVPGAIMSILNISSIEKAVEKGINHPAEIFNETRNLIINRLKKDGSEGGGKDGMDASLICINSDKTKMTYVAAQNPIWIIRDNNLIELKAEKMPVGKHDLAETPFKGGEFELIKGDLIYSMTDGYQDQFGGEKGKKFKVVALKKLLLEISNLSMNEQLEVLSKTFNEWIGNLEQIDDVCIIGLRV